MICFPCKNVQCKQHRAVQESQQTTSEALKFISVVSLSKDLAGADGRAQAKLEY